MPENKNRQQIEEAQKRLRGASPEAVLEWGLKTYSGRIAIASSMSIEDAVVIAMAVSIDPKARIFALDTGRLHEETYLTADSLRDRYRTNIEWYFPERSAVESLERAKGTYSFMESLDNRHECCNIRKVEPLGRALSTLDAWVTGLRREQSVTRADIPEIEVDDNHGGMAKLNPLISWTDADVRAYAKEHRVPMHPLHNQGYPSIGCAPCTRAVAAGEHPRSGRWWWEDPDSKECGLHVGPDGKLVRNK
jgi:phosphoadenosine phosphosulfate reductase